MKVLKHKGRGHAGQKVGGKAPILIVEFSGPPGSGKTVLSRRVQERLRQERVCVQRVKNPKAVDFYLLRRKDSNFKRMKVLGRVLARTAQAQLDDPPTFWCFVRAFIVSLWDEKVTCLIRRVHFSTGFAAETRRLAAKPGLYLRDGGVINLASDIGRIDDRRSTRVLEQQLRLAPHLVVLVQAGPETLRRRVLARHEQPAERELYLIPREFSSIWEASQKAIEKLLVLRDTLPELCVVSVNNDDYADTETTARHIAGVIRGCWHNLCAGESMSGAAAQKQVILTSSALIGTPNGD